ncbi:MAG: sialate O-acetylesterase [Saccharofermentanales bacterium]
MKKTIMVLTCLLLGFNAYGCNSSSKNKNSSQSQLTVNPAFKINTSVPETDKFVFPGLVGDSMILQRNSNVLLWGRYDKDGPVAADINGKLFFGKCETGEFNINIDTTSQLEAFDITIYSLTEKAVIHDVKFGEVYLCAGQSNMQINMAYIKAPELKENVDNDNLRFVYVPVQTCDKPVTLPVGDVSMSWQKMSNAVLPNYSAVAYYFSEVMYEKLDVPIGIIWVAAGDTIIASWLPDTEAKSIPDYYQEDRPPYFVRSPAHMYNTMISPILKYKAHGVIWYQGENQDKQYDEFLTKLINVWRRDFKNDTLEFTVIQLPGCDGTWISKWEEIRESQKKVVSTLPLCAMSINIDCGDKVEIHPVDKRPIGERAAYATLTKFFGMKGLPQSPTVKSYKTVGNTLEIEFDNTGAGLILKNNGAGFEIASNAAQKEAEFICPKILSVERYNELISKMNAEDKEIFSFYYKFFTLDDYKNDPARLALFKEKIKISTQHDVYVYSFMISEDDRQISTKYVDRQIDEIMKRINYTQKDLALDNAGNLVKEPVADVENISFYKADAKIVNNKLILSCKGVSNPNMAKYAFANMPVVSLYNKEGMPAEQFNIKVK